MGKKGKKKAPRLTVLTYNVYVSNGGWTKDTQGRCARQCAAILAMEPVPDLVCLQEAFIKEAQAAYIEKLSSRYDAFSAWADRREFCHRCAAGVAPAHVVYGASAACAALAALARLAARALPAPMWTVAWLLWAHAIVLGVASVALIPAVLRTILVRLNAAPAFGAVTTEDVLGTVILVRKEQDDTPSGFALRPVADSLRAIRLAKQAGDYSVTKGVVSLVNAWFSETFLHRGLLTLAVDVHRRGGARGGAKADAAPALRLLVATGHLQTGVDNPNRIAQVREMAATLEAEAAAVGRRRGQGQGEDQESATVVLAMDCNADWRRPEMEWLRGADGGYTDSLMELNEALVRGGGGLTWDNTNPLTQGNLREPDQRTDYVFYQRRDAAKARAGSGARLRAVRSEIVLNHKGCDSDHYGSVADFEVLDD